MPDRQPPFPEQPPWRDVPGSFEPPSALDPASPPAAPPSEPPVRVPFPTVPPPPSPAGGSGRRVLLVVIGAVGVLVVGLVGCTIWLASSVVSGVKGPIDAANEFLAAIDDGNYVEALELSDPRCADMTVERLQATFAGSDIDYYLNSVSTSNDRSTVRGSLDIDGRAEPGIAVEMVERGDEWLVCDFEIRPGD